MLDWLETENYVHKNQSRLLSMEQKHRNFMHNQVPPGPFLVFLQDAPNGMSNFVMADFGSTPCSMGYQP
jgi:hypothetical protein